MIVAVTLLILPPPLTRRLNDLHPVPVQPLMFSGWAGLATRWYPARQNWMALLCWPRLPTLIWKIGTIVG
jgi:hypothetical protein